MFYPLPDFMLSGLRSILWHWLHPLDGDCAPGSRRLPGEGLGQSLVQQMKCRAVVEPWWGLPAGGMWACLGLPFAVPGPGFGAELCKGQCNLTTGEKFRYEVCAS